MAKCRCGCEATVTNLYLRGHQFRRDPLERFWEKVDRGSGCWIWMANTNREGYGMFWDGTRIVRAHRFSYEHHRGAVPEGLELDHLCRNPACVNPDHLEAVSHHDNLLRGDAPAARQARQTHCKRGHPLADANLIVDKRGRRKCRICSRASGKRGDRNRRAIAAESQLGYPLIWRVKIIHPEWFGRRCRIVIHGGHANRIGNRLIEFEDGYRVVCPGMYVRRP